MNYIYNSYLFIYIFIRVYDNAHCFFGEDFKANALYWHRIYCINILYLYRKNMCNIFLCNTNMITKKTLLFQQNHAMHSPHAIMYTQL